jgi:gliding motility-associated-like protein
MHHLYASFRIGYFPKWLLILAAGWLCATGRIDAQPLVNNKGAQISMKGGALMIVKGRSLHNVSGTLDNAGLLIVEDDFRNDGLCTGAGAGSGIIEVGGDWVNNNLFVADQGRVRLTGGNQLISGSTVTSFYNLTLQGTGIKTQTLDAVVNHELNLNDRELATDNFKMSVTNPDPNAILRTSGFVSSEGTGQLERNLTVASAYLFPVGSSNGLLRYRPVRIRPNGPGSFQYGVRMANVDPTIEGFDRQDRETDICEINPQYYHRIYRNGGGTNPVDLRFFYDPSADGPWETHAHWQNVPQWEYNPTVTIGSAPPFQIIKVQGWTDFSSPAFALARLQPVIDSSLLSIQEEYCNLSNGFIKGISVEHLTAGSTTIWTNASGAVVGTGIKLTDVPSGTYTLTVTKPNGCTEEATFTIDNIAAYTSSLNVTDVLCKGDPTGSVNLAIGGGGYPPFQYSWSNGSNTQDINGVNAGIYTVTITDSEGCRMVKTVAIHEPDSALQLSTQVGTETCERMDGSATAIVKGGTQPYTYVWDSQPPQFTAVASGLPAGSYTILVTDDQGCIKSKTVTVGNIPSPTALFEANPNPGLAVLLSQGSFFFTNLSQDAIRYEWDFGDGTFSDGKNPVHTYADTGNFAVTLTAINAVGCSAEYVVGPFWVIPDGALYIPNAFTPNADGHNDYFQVLGEGLVFFRMVIFNRWGKEVAVLNSVGERWDGTHQGVAVPEGVYAYKLDAEANGGKVYERGGTITVIR